MGCVLEAVGVKQLLRALHAQCKDAACFVTMRKDTSHMCLDAKTERTFQCFPQPVPACVTSVSYDSSAL